MKRAVTFLLLNLFFTLVAPCAEWNSFVLNFDKNIYGHGSQTWQISSYNETWTFFANKKGMLQFDGSEWKTRPMSNQFDVRSVLASPAQKRIYVGGINEFGYYQPDEVGNMIYSCMSDTLPDACRYLGNVWGIHEVDHILYFQGDNKVVKYINGNYTAIEMNAKIDCSSMVRGTLYLGTDQGVWVLIGNRFFPLQGAEDLTSKRIRGFVPYKEGVLIVTAYDGLFYFDGRKVTPFLTGAESFMLENEVFCVAATDTKIALGTIHKGILIIDSSTLDVKYCNEFNGLYNNTVLSLTFDKIGNLWAGLDNGISYVYLNSPYSNLYAYPYSFGTGYSAFVEKDKLYLGTNRGLYYTAYPVKSNGNSPQIHSVALSSGQVWNLCKVGDDLFCAHDRGLFRLEDNTMHRLGELTGVWSCKSLFNCPNLMLIGTYDGLHLAKYEAGKWQLMGKIEGVNDSCRFFEQESEQIIWYQNVDHVVRLELSDDFMHVTSSKSYSSQDGLPEHSTIHISKVKGKICFVTDSGIYKFNKELDQIEPCIGLNNQLTGATNYLRLAEYQNHLISLTSYEICISNSESYKRGSNATVYTMNRSLIELVPTFESFIPIADSLVVIPNENGFALLSHSYSGDRINHHSSIFIKKMYALDSLVYVANFLGEKKIPQLSYKQGAIRFEYGVSYGMNDDVRYQYRLNKEAWSSFSFTHMKEYSQLHEGTHLFEVKALFPDGTISIDSLEFQIYAPWFRSYLAYLLYFLLFLWVAWLIYNWDNDRVGRKKQQAIVEKEYQLQKLELAYEEEREEKERQIMLLEKEKLEYELQHKSQETTHLMINVVRKNEMLTDIKAEIQRVASQMKSDNYKESKQQLMVINNKIESNIQSDEVLRRIEEEFDLLHNNFMKRLKNRHADLSNSERMMCAYLKMKLSTKEIAPLLNISVRGVETIRYRLRKKFNLEREDSLTQYLENGL
ncbi:MAG: transcriptional regulator [Phocaeicola sp.]